MIGCVTKILGVCFLLLLLFPVPFLRLDCLFLILFFPFPLAVELQPFFPSYITCLYLYGRFLNSVYLPLLHLPLN